VCRVRRFLSRVTSDLSVTCSAKKFETNLHETLLVKSLQSTVSLKIASKLVPVREKPLDTDSIPVPVRNLTTSDDPARPLTNTLTATTKDAENYVLTGTGRSTVTTQHKSFCSFLQGGKSRRLKVFIFYQSLLKIRTRAGKERMLEKETNTRKSASRKPTRGRSLSLPWSRITLFSLQKACQTTLSLR
jgi:hypothetical protein